MKRIRIGNEFDLELTLTSLEGVELPLVFEQVSVALVAPNRKRAWLRVDDVADGTIRVHVSDEDQCGVGVYRIEVWLNRGDENQKIGDKTTAFYLVPLSTQETEVVDTEDAVIDMGTIEMDFVSPFVKVDDTLESDSASSALSARQGKVLDEKISESVAEARKSFKTLDDLIKADEDYINSVDRAVQKNARAISDHETKIAEISNNVSVHSASFESFKRDNNVRHEAASAEIEALTQHVNKNASSVENLTRKTAEATELAALAENRSREVENTVANVDSSLKALSNIVGSLDAELLSESMKNEAQDARITDVSSKFTQFRADLDHLKADSNLHAASISVLDESLTALDADQKKALRPEDVATSERNGAMSKEDKARLDNLDRMLMSKDFNVMAFEPEQLNPEPIEQYGDKKMLERVRAFLVDTTQQDGDYATGWKLLRKNNWLRYDDGSYAPTVGISEEMRAECDVELYLDAEHTQKWCDAGQYDALEFLQAHGYNAKLYDAEGNEVRVLKPWETTETKYTIMIGFVDASGNPCAVTLVDNVKGNSGKVWRGILPGYVKSWDGVDLSQWRLEACALSPDCITTINGKARCFFYLHNPNEGVERDNTSGAKGFSGLVSAYDHNMMNPRNTDLNGMTVQDFCRSNNINDPTSPVPFAEGGYHAWNTIINAVEARYSTKNICGEALFGKGFSDWAFFRNEEEYIAHGGVRWRPKGESNWSYGYRVNNNTAFRPTLESNTQKFVGFLSGGRPLTATLEPHMAASYAVETGVASDTDFEFYGRTYMYSDVKGEYSLKDDCFDCRVYCKTHFEFSAYDNNNQLREYEAEASIRRGLASGFNLCCHMQFYVNGGYEIIIVEDKTKEENGGQHEGRYKFRSFIQPDQRKWVYEKRHMIRKDEKFAFEDSYILTNSDDIFNETWQRSYSRQRVPYSALSTSGGATAETGDCGQGPFAPSNYWMPKNRLMVTEGGYYYSAGVARYLICSWFHDVNDRTGGLALVLLSTQSK